MSSATSISSTSNSDRPSVGIMGTPVSSGNRGVLALAESLVRLCLEAAPGVEPVIMGSDRSGAPVRMHPAGQPLDVRQARWRLNARSGRDHLFWIAGMALLYRGLPIPALRRAISARTPWIRAVEQARFVGDVRGGDSFSDIYGMQRFLLATLAVWTVIAVKGSLVQFPQTYGPYKSRTARIIARWLLLRSRVIVARDTRSQKVAQDLVGTRKQVLLSPDVAFALHVREPAQLEIEPPLPRGSEDGSLEIGVGANHPARSENPRDSHLPPPTSHLPRAARDLETTGLRDDETTRQRDYGPQTSDHRSQTSALCPLSSGSALSALRALRPIGLNVNGLMYNGGYTGKNQFGLKMDYRRFLEELATALLTQTDRELLLVPHTYAPAGDIESDNEASEKLRASLPEGLRPRVRIVTGDYDCHEIKAVIGCCDFFVGSRMHSCIGALSQGVPCVGVAYSMKFLGVFESVGMGEFVVDARDHDTASAVARTLELYQTRDDVRQPLGQAALAAREKLKAVFAAMVASAP